MARLRLLKCLSPRSKLNARRSVSIPCRGLHLLLMALRRNNWKEGVNPPLSFHVLFYHIDIALCFLPLFTGSHWMVIPLWFFRFAAQVPVYPPALTSNRPPLPPMIKREALG